MTNLTDVINHVQPTALLGLSTMKVCAMPHVRGASAEPRYLRARSASRSLRPCLR